MSIPSAVAAALARHPAIDSVRQAGSRDGGTPTELSDWDFEVQTGDFPAVAEALPELVRALSPLAQQWDRLAHRRTYMLLLPGPVKVDLLFAERQTPAAPWSVDASSLAAIDHHFWDWILWLGSKQLRDQTELVDAELSRMATHLLGPIGVGRSPSGIDDAIDLYRAARGAAEERLRARVDRRAEREVVLALTRAGLRQA
jgi:hypothetical protein